MAAAFRQDAWRLAAILFIFANTYLAGLIGFGGILKAVRKNSEPLRG
ncbi:hypothetical protein CHCC14821_1819 [Bacillus paralicheniformis]|nr:hypothetical protein CHCC14821_1819 [Bacillus paralicheniformis]TWM63175.1 hypothetical protein CHCC14814_3639 [Bacillus paralicheniformis]